MKISFINSEVNILYNIKSENTSQPLVTDLDDFFKALQDNVVVMVFFGNRFRKQNFPTFIKKQEIKYKRIIDVFHEFHKKVDTPHTQKFKKIITMLY